MSFAMDSHLNHDTYTPTHLITTPLLSPRPLLAPTPLLSPRPLFAPTHLLAPHLCSPHVSQLLHIHSWVFLLKTFSEELLIFLHASLCPCLLLPRNPLVVTTIADGVATCSLASRASSYVIQGPNHDAAGWW
jgi:hypothetical protein